MEGSCGVAAGSSRPGFVGLICLHASLSIANPGPTVLAVPKRPRIVIHYDDTINMEYTATVRARASGTLNSRRSSTSS